MPKPIAFLLLFLLCSTSLFSQQFSEFFTDKACRIDLQLSGNNKNTSAYLSKIVQEPFWGGRRAHLADDMNLGEYRFMVLDSLSNKLIYIDDFSTLYFEWQSTPEASLVNKSFEQSIQFPYPQKSVKVVIERRLDFDKWEKLIQFGFSPDDKLIRKTRTVDVPIKIICKTASPEKAIDIAVIAEGYTAKQRAKFYKDAQQLADNLFSHEPFLKYKSRINIYAIAALSVDTGITKPQDANWRNTALGSHYYTFYSDRYLTTPNVFTVREIMHHWFHTMLSTFWPIQKRMAEEEFTTFTPLHRRTVNAHR